MTVERPLEPCGWAAAEKTSSSSQRLCEGSSALPCKAPNWASSILRRKRSRALETLASLRSSRTTPTGAYRAVYAVRFEEAVFVLHCFQKKSKSGIATPKEEMDVIRRRLKAAEALAKEIRNANAGH